VVFVLEDVTVVHVAAAEDLEADDDVDDFLRVDADGVLEAAFVVVELCGMPSSRSWPMRTVALVPTVVIPLSGCSTVAGCRSRTSGRGVTALTRSETLTPVYSPTPIVRL
jgi:hypothetical protein